MEKYVDLRSELEAMTSQQLAERLREETGKEVPDDDLVLLILGILEERDADKPVQLDPKSEEAWKVYQNRVKARVRRPVLRAGWIARAAIVILTATILFSAIPQEAQAESFWDRFFRWTKDIVEFFSPNDNEGRFEEYQFTTDNPGLQQVYDAVVEMGITEPVVPMWLPDESELVELAIESFPAKDFLFARFKTEHSEIIYQVDVYRIDVTHEYQKNETAATFYENSGVIHSIVRNNEQVVAIWNRDNIECSLSLNGKEDTLRRILGTIYYSEGE